MSIFGGTAVFWCFKEVSALWTSLSRKFSVLGFMAKQFNVRIDGMQYPSRRYVCALWSWAKDLIIYRRSCAKWNWTSLYRLSRSPITNASFLFLISFFFWKYILILGFWAFLFFLMLLLLGVSSQFGVWYLQKTVIMLSRNESKNLASGLTYI